MANVEAKSLSKSELEAVERLLVVDVSKTEAKVLLHLIKSKESLARNIEKATDLRQPEVSSAVRKLIGRGWVTHRDIKSEGKGRPQQMYSLVMSKADITKAINKLFYEKIQSLEKERDEVNNMLKEA